MLLDGTVVLVTGSGRRVGRCIALHLARAGADVAVHCNRSAAPAGRTAEQIRAVHRRCEVLAADLADAEQVRSLVPRVVEKLGRIDLLVNNASTFEPDPQGQVSPELWQRIMQVNVIAPAMLSQATYEHLKQHNRTGKIVNLCDISAERPWGRMQAYCASKAALLALTRATAKAMAPLVQVNAVSPGIVQWPEGVDPATQEAAVRRIPLGRIGTPDDVAAAVLFLVQSGDYITGQVIRVDGGRSIA